jgi:acyl-CoA thioester hydrolase
VDLCKACGFNYRDMEREDGVLLAVAASECRYLYPARFDDEVIVKTWIADANPRLAVFQYELRLADSDRLLATGTTRHVFLSRDMRPTRLPAKYHAMFGIRPGETATV